MSGLVRTTEVVAGIAAVSTGLVGGVYAAFSTMVMPALRSGPDAEALAVMQRINVHALQPGFMVIFWTSAVASTATLVLTWLPGGGHDRWTTAAAILALSGFVITAAINVPRNNAIAGLDPSSAADLRVAGDLLGQWVLANHVRAVASTLALAAFLRRFAVLGG